MYTYKQSTTINNKHTINDQTSTYKTTNKQQSTKVQNLYEKAQQEQLESRQEKVCRLIEFASKGEVKKVCQILNKLTKSTN